MKETITYEYFRMNPKRRPSVYFHGGGKYFFWNAGAAEYLRRNYDLSNVSIFGNSAGAISAVILACNIPSLVAIREARRVYEEFNVDRRRLGILGMWGRFVREWLERILPEDAHERCSGRVFIRIQRVPFQNWDVYMFSDRQYLIETIMTSVHLPFIMDMSLTRVFDGHLCWDIPWTVENTECYGPQFHYAKDRLVQNGTCSKSRINFTPREMYELERCGYLYVHRRRHKFLKWFLFSTDDKRSGNSSTPKRVQQKRTPSAPEKTRPWRFGQQQGKRHG